MFPGLLRISPNASLPFRKNLLPRYYAQLLGKGMAGEKRFLMHQAPEPNDSQHRYLSFPNPSPVSPSEFYALFQAMVSKCPPLSTLFESSKNLARPEEGVGAKIGLAVSGGPDSVALCWLAKQAFPADRLQAYIVDHGLSHMGINEDPELISSWLNQLQIKHEVLKLNWPLVGNSELQTLASNMGLSKGKLVERCRELRYEALFKACLRNNTSLLLTGHNFDDDLVTFFYRMAHLSGLDGLAGMKATGTFPLQTDHPLSHQFFIGHPLLTIPKARLLETCRASNLPIHYDTSNGNIDYRRNSVHQALVNIQKLDSTITTERLMGLLSRIKQIRTNLHDQLVKAYDKSVIVNQLNGDATIILNDERWLKQSKRYLMTRLISTLMQYAGCGRYPARTPAINALVDDLQQAYIQYQEKQQTWLARLPRQIVQSTLQPIDKTKRVDFKQHTMAGCTFYSLSRSDAQRRIAMQERLAQRNLEYGPSFLIQRDPPVGLALHQQPELRGQKIDLSPGETYLWDNRIFIQYQIDPSSVDKTKLSDSTLDNTKEADQRFEEKKMAKQTRSFIISHMTMADVRAFEDLTPGFSGLRKRLYTFVGTTPGSHLYQIPVIREPTSGYIGFPTLMTDYPLGAYKWTTSYAGLNFLTMKFMCLP